MRKYDANMSRLFLALVTISVAAVPSHAQQPCESLTNLAVAGLTITSATSIPKGPFILPSSPNQAQPVPVPAFCRVAAVVAKEVRFEIWMPAEWNRKLLGIGNGGLAGIIPYSPMVRPLALGYATSSTDTGHTGVNTNDGGWALGHYDRIVNFADRAIHVMAEADKVILRAFYGAPPARAYFSGCSQGGHEALIEAQRYPADFDGIIAGDPANNWTRHYAGGHLWSAMAMEGDGYIPAAKVPLIADAVNNACDALDGIKDGILNDPRRCHFDPATLLCKTGDTAACLTNAQIDAVRKLWTGLRDRDGDQIYPGLVPGGEAGPGGWTNWITGREPGKGGHSNLGIPFFKYFVFENPDWDFRTFRFDASDGFDSDVDFTDAKLGSLFNAVDPSLAGFKAKGGKLIQYHGWSDPDITPLNSINYYDSVTNTIAHGGNHGVRDTKDFYRLFMVPGMQHCGGGPGPTTFDMIEPLEQWVEHGVAPAQVIASHLNNGVVDRTRPLCPYPQEAQWKGSGSTDDAANFACAFPARP
jgi:feruloyl esterase